MNEFLSEVAGECDAAGKPAMAAGPLSAGTALTGVISALRGAGVPWLTIFALVGKILPVVVADIAAGKTLAQIVADVLAAVVSGQLSA